jgi:hypothetical protein
VLMEAVALPTALKKVAAAVALRVDH